MTDKHEWISDDLCLIEKTTGVKFYGTVCTDIEFLVKYMNDLINENEQLKKDLEYYKTERMALLEYIDKKDDLKIELKCSNSGKQSGQND